MRTKRGVQVSFSGGCLYSNPPLYRYTANHGQGLCTVCTLSAVVAASLVGGGRYLYTFSLFLPDPPIMNWIHNKEKMKI